jgi:hypothetical protein
VGLHHAGDVADGHRRPALTLEDHPLDVMRLEQIAHAADDELLVAVTKEAPADVAIRLVERPGHVGQRETVGDEP